MQATTPPSRSALRVCSVALAVTLIGCRQQDEEPIFRGQDVGIEIGLGKQPSDRVWSTLTVYLHNSGANFDGTVEVSGRSQLEEIAPTQWELAIEIPAGEKRRLVVPVYMKSWTGVRVRLRQDRYERTIDRDLPFSLAERSRVLIIGEDPPAMTALEASVEASFPTRPADAPVGVTPKCKVSRTVPAKLLPMTNAYDAFDLMLLWGTTLTNAPEGALPALRRWVEKGGTLVVFPGPEWAGGLPPEFAELLGVTAGTIADSPPPGLAAAVGAPELELEYYPIWPQAQSATAGELSVVSPLGAGRVETFSIAPKGRAFPSEAAAPGLYAALRPAFVRSLTFAGSPSRGLASTEGWIANDLIQMTGFSYPPGALVAGALTAYMAIGFLLPAYLLRKRRRRELVFVWGIAVAALATFGIWRYGLLVSAQDLGLAEISIARPHADGRALEVTSFLCLHSPKQMSFQLQDESAIRDLPAHASPRVRLLESGVGGRYSYGRKAIRHPRTTIGVDFPGRQWLEDVALRTNGLRFFRVDQRLPHDLPVEWKVERGSAPGEAAELTVQNGTSEPVDILVVQDDVAAWLAAAPAGSTASASVGANIGHSGSRASVQEIAQMWNTVDLLPTHEYAPIDAVITRVLRAVMYDAQGLGQDGPEAGGWGFASPDGEEAWRALREDLDSYQPRFAILVVRAPLFEPAQAVPRRSALSFVVIEIPPAP